MILKKKIRFRQQKQFNPQHLITLQPGPAPGFLFSAHVLLRIFKRANRLDSQAEKL